MISALILWTISSTKLLISSLEILGSALKFLHFNASQWDPSWGMDLAEQHFDIVCKKFMTMCLTQCPVPEVIYFLQTFTVLWPCLKFYRVTSAVVWLKVIFLAAFDGKLTAGTPTAIVFCLCTHRFKQGVSLHHPYISYFTKG